jgi:PadR family transcriptional regulator, regulatory protein AphA
MQVLYIIVLYIYFVLGDDMSKMNKTKYAILGVLNEKPGSGYDIKKFCDHIAYFWNENYSHIYPVLKQMEREGLLTKNTEQNEGRPPKNVYSITDEGKRELVKWLMLPVEPNILRAELLLKLFFSDSIPVGNMLEKLKEKIDEQKKIKAILDHGEAEIRSEEISKRKLRASLAVINWGKTITEATIRWCEETIQVLQEDSEDN